MICVDDGSTDGSGAILDECRERLNAQTSKHLNFRVLHQQNAGVSAARNAALEIATGDWIGFLDGDDIYHEDILVTVARAVEEHSESDVVRVGLKSFEDGKGCAWMPGLGETMVRDLSRELDGDALGGWFWQRFYRRDLVRGLRFRPLTNGEDMLFMAQALAKARCEVAVGFAGYGYRQRKGSASSRAPDRTYVESMLTYGELVLEELVRSGKAVDPGYIRLLANQMSEYVVDAMRGLDRADRRALLPFAAEKWAGFGRCPLLNAFQRLRFRLFSACPFWPVACVIWGIPYRLKRMGFHRRTGG